MKYGAIYADPPWNFKVFSEKGMGRSASAWYDTMTIGDIQALPVADYAAPDCVLLMWVTDPFLPQGLNTLAAWGFQFKTVGFYWVKGDLGDGVVKWPVFSLGTGYWTRANPEQCLLATRGSPKRLSADVRKLVISPRREHSRKPDEMYGYIERLCAGPYLELFARQRVEGWDVAYSSEADSGPAIARRWKSSGGPDTLHGPSSADEGI